MRSDRIGWQVEEPLRIHHPELSAQERKQRALTLLKQVELEDPERIYQSYPHQISGGQRQRVMIAAAMICEPKLLIADEPTTALDVTVQAQIVKLLKRINQKKGTAILFISHDLSLVGHMSDRVAVMYLGQIVELGPTDQVLGQPRHPYTQLLLDSVPRTGEPLDEDLALRKTDLPGNRRLPDGCYFRDRCPLAVEGCERPQPLQPAAGDRSVRCWRNR